MNKKKLTVIIPCAGSSKKKNSFGAKPLIPINNTECLLDKQVRLIRSQYSNPEIIAVVGFQSDKVIPHIPEGVKIIENELFENTSVSRSISMALRVASNNNILIFYGDMIGNSACLPKLGKTSFVVVDSKSQMKEEDVGLNCIDNQAMYFSYGFNTKWANILYISNQDLDIFAKNIHLKESKKMFTFEVLNNIISSGCYIQCIEPKNMKIIKIDTIKDIEAARQI